MRDPYLMISGAGLIFIHPFFFFVPIVILFFIRRVLNERWMFFLFPFVWVAFEFAHSFGDTAFPWITIGNSQASDIARSQFASFTGVYGLSFHILVVNLLTFYFVKHYSTGKWKFFEQKSMMTLTAIIILVFLPKVYGEIVLSSHPVRFEKGKKELRVGVVQPNIDPWGKWDGGEKLQQLKMYQNLTDSLVVRGADFVVWPETALPYFIFLPQNIFYRDLVQEQVNHLRINLLTGFPDAVFYSDSTQAKPSSHKSAIRGEWYDTYNSAVLFSPRTIPSQRYHKMLLVPFGERMPFADALAFLNFLEWGVGISGWGVGKDFTVFSSADDNGKFKFSTVICYESIYPSFVRKFVADGAEFLVVITNDSWWGNTSGYIQHAEYLRLRAIENRRWIVRCANGGISGFIDPYGRWLKKSDYDTKEILTHSIYMNDEITTYVKFGDVIAWICVGTSLASTLLILPVLALNIRRKPSAR